MPIEEQPDQIFETIQTQEEPSLETKEGRTLTIGKLKIKLKLVFILAGGFFLLLVLMAILSGQKPTPVPTVTPTPTPTPTPIEEIIRSPSAYATDSAILKIQADIETIEEKILSTDLKEIGLNPPVLDMNVNFKE